MAGDYESDLCESLGRIQTKSANLLLEADKSHMYAMRMRKSKHTLSKVVQAFKFLIKTWSRSCLFSRTFLGLLTLV